ncbi:acetyl-CoA synthetase [Trichoderma asperellum]
MAGGDRGRPTSPNGLILEAWSQGLMVGSLFVMAAIVISNMRKRILLHKLILAEEYEELYKESILYPDRFWGNLARQLLTWSRDFDTVQHGSLANGDVSWFLEGQLNACFNCLDRHAVKAPDKIAIIYEPDSGDDFRTVSYGSLLREVCKLAHSLRNMGVIKGSTVGIYMPMMPEAVVAMLACARIGAVHAVVFAGFSANSLRDRIINAKCQVIITTNESKRGGKTMGTKSIVDAALENNCSVSNVLVFRHTESEVPWTPGRDVWWHEEVDKYPGYIAPEPMASEDPLLLLYTSGSTGAAKGIMHTTGGYLVGAAATGKYVFDLRPEDRFFCAGDIGWITGHTYVVYAPLLLGATTLVFGGTPTYPTPSRYWNAIDRHEVTHFYVAPTALRLLKQFTQEAVLPEMKNLRVLGSVGEPIAPEIWNWYSEVIGKGKCDVIDTYWQTETGSHAITPLAGITPTKPGSASLPFFGIDTVIIDPVSGREIHGNNVEGVLAFKRPWPSMARTVWGDHKRYKDTYLNAYPGYYFTGDGAYRDHDGLYWIRGRVDDVINVSGHRLSTAEIEAAILEHPRTIEAAAIGVPDEITGQSVIVFTSSKDGQIGLNELAKELVLQVRKSIGPFAAPKFIYVVQDLPKTRSGKIMRRILRKILMGEGHQLGDTSSLSNPSVVDEIIKTVHNRLA